MKLHPTPHLRSRAFSLVEVTLAIGITAVALVSLMGMLPKGMKTLQRANDQAVMGRIHQQILGEIQLTPWEDEAGGGTSPVESFHGQIRFYDDQGIELFASEKGGMSHVYTARVSVPKVGGRLPLSVGAGSYNGAGLPGDAASSDEFLRLVVVEVTSNVDPRFLESPASGFDQLLTYPGAVFTYRTMIAKMGRMYDAKNS